VGECVRGANIIDFEGMKSQILNEVELTVQNFDKHRVIESYKNGESWYREYADGWCEQGGHVIPDAVVKLPVSLLRPFIDTSYTVVFGNEYTTTANATSCVETATKAVDSFVIIDSSVKTFGTYWVAYGFVK
jgi:hypothetical protein